MSNETQGTDGGGVSVADMSPEEINAALAAVANELGGKGESQTESADAAMSERSSPDDQLPDGSNRPAISTSTAADHTQAPERSGAATPETDTEAALDRIDSDLAELESLLAQTSSDGTSIPAGIAQAPPPPPESQDSRVTTSETAESSEPETTSETEAATGESVDDAASGTTPLNEELADTGGIDDMLLDNGGGSPLSSSPPVDTASKAESAATAEMADETAEVAIEPFDDSPSGGFGSIVSKVILSSLTLIDKPFARLGPRGKTIMGLVAVATLLVAVATWIVGCIQ